MLSHTDSIIGNGIIRLQFVCLTLLLLLLVASHSHLASEEDMATYCDDEIKNVVVLGGSYGGKSFLAYVTHLTYVGMHAAMILARKLPPSHRVILIERNTHFNRTLSMAQPDMQTCMCFHDTLSYLGMNTKHLFHTRQFSLTHPLEGVGFRRPCLSHHKSLTTQRAWRLLLCEILRISLRRNN